jgi:hypothetical protein
LSSIAIGSIIFAVVFGGALLGMFLRTVMPKDHLSDASKDIVRIAMGLVATMTALILGLLISSAKNSFDTLNGEITEMSSKIILLDRALANYGPEAKEARGLLHDVVANLIDQMAIKSSDPTRLKLPTGVEDPIYDKLQELVPKDDRQRTFQADALGILKELRQMRWLIYEQQSTSIPTPMLFILVLWLTVLFISFGLYAPANGTVITSLLVCAFSVSGAIFLIMQLYRPFLGPTKISAATLRAALLQLGN